MCTVEGGDINLTFAFHDSSTAAVEIGLQKKR